MRLIGCLHTKSGEHTTLLSHLPAVLNQNFVQGTLQKQNMIAATTIFRTIKLFGEQTPLQDEAIAYTSRDSDLFSFNKQPDNNT